jgi:hypothetical protein
MSMPSCNTYRKRARRIPRRRPSPPPIKPKALIPDNPEHTPPPKSLRIRLTLNLQHIERQNHNLANPNDTARRSVHERLARAPPKRRVEFVAVVLGEVVPCEGLPAVFVHALQDLVGGGVAEAGEEGEEAGAGCGGGFFAEDDLVELRGGGYLCEKCELNGGGGDGVVVVCTLP